MSHAMSPGEKEPPSAPVSLSPELVKALHVINHRHTLPALGRLPRTLQPPSPFFCGASAAMVCRACVLTLGTHVFDRLYRDLLA